MAPDLFCCSSSPRPRGNPGYVLAEDSLQANPQHAPNPSGLEPTLRPRERAALFGLSPKCISRHRPRTVAPGISLPVSRAVGSF